MLSPDNNINNTNKNYIGPYINDNKIKNIPHFGNDLLCFFYINRRSISLTKKHGIDISTRGGRFAEQSEETASHYLLKKTLLCSVWNIISWLDTY